MANRLVYNPAPKIPSNPSSVANKPVSKRSIWESYAVLPARTRLVFSLGICGVALAGILVSDALEEKLPAPKETAVIRKPS